MNITCPECVFIALGIQHAMLMRHIVVCGLSDSYSIFPHFLIAARFSGKSFFENKTCVLIVSKNFVWIIKFYSHQLMHFSYNYVSVF